MYQFLCTLLRDDDGATAVEYAVMLALILMAVFASVAAVGNNTNTLWTNSAASLKAAGVGS